MLIAATQAHADAMALIHASAFLPRERWTAAALGLQLGQRGAFGWIAPAGGLVLARIAADEAEVLTLAVDPAVQRAGLGRALLDRAMGTAQAQGASAMFLEVAAGNVAALALYAAADFVPVGRRPGYYPGGEDAVVLRRPLVGLSTFSRRTGR